jgi:NAD(P)-dependent dehydrogenase (short-subunit alcohol dehydrogenase family)
MSRVLNKVAIVTGGAIGIGRACACRLGQEGASVAIVDVAEKIGKESVASLKAEGVSAKFYKADVSRERKVRKTFEQIEKDFGSIDILVNNAGISGVAKPTHEVQEKEWDAVMDINVKGVFFCTKAAIPIMERTGGGSIINISSIYGIVGSPDFPPYHAAKGAVRLMSKTDALLYAAYNIRVNSVHPGIIWTSMVENNLKEHQIDLEQGREEARVSNPLQKVGEPEDIANGVLYLASDESRFVTGSELVIDGGYTCR